jgi:signal recognition particle receptor subunit beta
MASMVLVNYSGKEINAKVVYYGPGLCGKTTNLEFIYTRVPQNNRGKMVSMKTRTERTLFFDFLPLNLGSLAGFQTRFLLYTVPGQVYYNATRKLVLKGVDAVIFVADSGRGKMDENVESLENLRVNLREHGVDPKEVPLVLQYNKRDLPEVYTIEEMQEALNPEGAYTWFEATATTGEGVFETFKGVARLLLAHLSKSMGIAPQKGTAGGAITEALERPGTPPASGSMSSPAPAKPVPPRSSAAMPAPARADAPAPERAPEPGLELSAPGGSGATEAPSSGSLPALTHGPRGADAKLSIVHGERAAQDRAETVRPDETETDGARTLRVPVFVSQADIEAGVTIELVLRVDRSARDDDEVRKHFG